MSNTFKKLTNFLEFNNHICSHINSSRFQWCMSYPCSAMSYDKICHDAQKTLRELEINLRKKDHTCVKRCENTYPMSLNWCQKNQCIEQMGMFKIANIFIPEREETPQILWKVKDFLANLGHIHCCHISNDNKLVWCQEDICRVEPKKIIVDIEKIDEMKKRCIEVEKFAEDLKKKGHTCIFILQSYPPQIQWCGQDKCENNSNKKRKRDK